MHNLKRFFGWLIHKLSITLLANAVAIALPLLAFGIHVTNPEIVKGWLDRSNTYETLIDESLNLIALDASNANSQGTLGDTLDQNPFIDSRVIKDALKTTLTPEFIQSQAEGFIDGAYAWLDSDQEIPNFKFSLTSKNKQLATKLGQAMTDQFNQLPNCLPEELTPKFNLLTTLCKPEGIDIKTEVDNLVAELAGDQGLLADAIWTGEDLIKQNDQDSGLSEGQVKFAKSAFSGLKNGPLYLLLAGVLSIPLIYLTSKSRYRGYNEIGNTLFSGSLFTFIPAIIVAHWENLITNLIGDTGGNDTTIKAARSILEPFLQTAVSDIASLVAWLSGALLLFSSLMVGYGFYLKRVHQIQEEDRIASEIAKSREQRRIKELKQHAKKQARYDNKTLDPKRNKPIKPKKQTLSKAQAAKIANDPASKSKKISELNK